MSPNFNFVTTDRNGGIKRNGFYVVCCTAGPVTFRASFKPGLAVLIWGEVLNAFHRVYITILNEAAQELERQKNQQTGEGLP